MIRKNVVFMLVFVIGALIGGIIENLAVILPSSTNKAMVSATPLKEESKHIVPPKNEEHKKREEIKIPPKVTPPPAPKKEEKPKKVTPIITMEDLIQKHPVNLSQGVNRQHLRKVIGETLQFLGVNSKKWVDLLMITAQIESDLGTLLKQVKGPAVGIFQMEPATEKSVWEHYLKVANKGLADKIRKLRVEARVGACNEMEYNVAYATSMAYTLYLWRKVDPNSMTVEDMIAAYKKYYNTYAGKSTIEGAMRKLRGSRIL